MAAQRTGDVVTVIDGCVAWVVIDRPEAHNALSPDVLGGLRAAITAATAAGCPVMVLRGAGGTLSAGADLNYLRGIRENPAALRAYITSIGETIQLLADAPFISVCVVQHYALAGGCEILLACDLAVVSEEARIGDRHLEYGLLPGAGGSVRLARAVPGAVARRLLFTGEMIDGAAAARAGLVSHAVPGVEVDSEVEALVARLAALSGSVLAQMKGLYRAAMTTDPETAMVAERETLIRHLGEDPAAAEGLDAFAERRAPDFSQFRADPADAAPDAAGGPGLASVPSGPRP